MIKMVFTDFVVRYNSKTDSKEDIAKRIMYSLFVRRNKNNKPCIIFISGDSGEGKSWGALRIQEILMEIQGIDYMKYGEVMNVFTPLEYPDKMQKVLFEKDYKKCNILCMHEAREIVRSKDWNKFLSIAVSDINAQARNVKRIITIVISQFIKDVTKDMRNTFTYYIKTKRPMGGDRKTRIEIYRIWKDDRDLENPRIKKRRIQGVLIDEHKRSRRVSLKRIRLSKPTKEFTDLFEEKDKEAKSKIIRTKLNKMMKELEKEINIEDDKVEKLVDFYIKKKDMINNIGKKNKSNGKFKLNKDFRDIHNLDAQETRDFQTLFNKALEKEFIEGEVEG